jgi:AraC-like DNA-binding protein
MERMIHSCHASPALRHVVRYYYQLEDLLPDRLTIQPVPARSPQILEFMFGAHYQVRRLDNQSIADAEPVALVGAKTHRGVELYIQGRVDAFTVAFQPGGLTTLFGIPVAELTDSDFNAEDVLGHQIGELHAKLAEVASLADRARVADFFLTALLPDHSAPNGIVRIATIINRREGIVRVRDLADRSGLGLRQFERRFRQEIGLAPKLYSRIVRFEAALRHKSLAPARHWTDIAHSLGYHDQMHMVHDFKQLSGESPSTLCDQMDMFVKPEAACGDHADDL